MGKVDENRNTTLRKVTIITTGSRGDIQPFVAIGIALKKAGYAVRVLTHPSETHTMILNDFGLEHVPFGIDCDRFMQQDKGARTSMETGDTINFFKCIAELLSNNTLAVCTPFHDELIGEGKHRPDLLIVSYLNRYFGLYAKHVLKIPTIEIKLQHWVFDDPSRAPMGMPTLPLGMHKFIETKLMAPQDYKVFQKLHECIADIMKDRKAITESSIVRLDEFLLYDQWLESLVKHSPLLPLFISQSLLFKDILCPTLPSLSKVKYVGPAIIETTDQMCGFQSFGDESERKIMQEFIDKQKPVYMGWGSMIRKSTHEMVLFAVEALMLSNQRGIILGGMAGLSMQVLKDAVAGNVNSQQIIDYAKENVLFVDKAPHEWLFPQVSLTVHHGGAGTLNATLRAGVPTIVTPIFGDQYDNSHVVQNLGVGVGFELQLQKITANDLSDAINAVLNDSSMATRAKEVGGQVRKECGCRAIVEEVEKFWKENVRTGSFSKEINNWKSATQKNEICQ
jgi:hypothetical protein